jgi:hypothetical protein
LNAQPRDSAELLEIASDERSAERQCLSRDECVQRPLAIPGRFEKVREANARLILCAFLGEVAGKLVQDRKHTPPSGLQTLASTQGSCRAG